MTAPLVWSYVAIALDILGLSTDGVPVQMNNGTFLLSMIFEYANEISDLNAREQL